jgi:hypothetical protein
VRAGVISSRGSFSDDQRVGDHGQRLFALTKAIENRISVSRSSKGPAKRHGRIQEQTAQRRPASMRARMVAPSSLRPRRN